MLINSFRRGRFNKNGFYPLTILEKKKTAFVNIFWIWSDFKILKLLEDVSRLEVELLRLFWMFWCVLR
jgi:hypothetical protein